MIAEPATCMLCDAMDLATWLTALSPVSTTSFQLDKPAFCVQYHPESSPGPHDSRYLFDRFTTLMDERKG